MIDAHQTYGIKLNRALRISAKREASDPHDHVYALWGLLKDIALSKPSYQISTQKLYSKTTKMLFFEDARLDDLEYAIGTGGSNAHGLASWVCDWSCSPIPSVLSTHLFNASNGNGFRTKQAADTILTVDACKVDMIRTTGITTGQDDGLPERLECLEAWWSLTKIEKSNERSAIWTTILGGCLIGAEGSRRILPEDLVTVKAWWNLATSLKEQGSYITHIPLEDQKTRVIDNRISEVVNDFRFWVTTQGFLGLGRQTLEKGDEVFIVKGSRVPLILRPIEGNLLPQFGRSERQQGYLFVSDCYLHGFMDGEAVKPDTKWQRVHLC